MGEYAEFTLSSEEDWDYPYIGADFDNTWKKKDATITQQKLCKEVQLQYNINFTKAEEGSFLWKCLVFYQKNNFLSIKQINKLLELNEIQKL